MSGWTPNASYWTGSQPRERHRVTTSPTELVHLFVAYAVLSVDLLLIYGALHPASGAATVNVPLLVTGLPFALTAALTGFVAHEMAHKVSAQRHGFWAEFRMSPFGLVFSLATAFFGFLFAAPGATIIGGMGDVREWGRTSLAGPALNLVEGAGFFVAAVASWDLFHAGTAWAVLALLAFINGWFAAFNLIPVGPLDGAKVLRWNKGIWAVSFAVSLAFAIGAFVVVNFGNPPL